MTVLRKISSLGVRAVVVFACCWGIWNSLLLARADALFRQDTTQSIHAAIALVPDGWQYFMRLAQLDREHAQELLTRSLALNRFDAQADIELGLAYEAAGDLERAEKQLLQAYEVDHTYLPRWTLANFYFRRDNMPAFWQWAHRAADMPADDIGALFELCWRAQPDGMGLVKQLVNDKPEMDKPEMLRQLIRFLARKNQAAAAADVAVRLTRTGQADVDWPEMLEVVNGLVGVDDAERTNQLWRLLVDQHWIVADATIPNNANFQREPLPVSFDWTLRDYGGLHSWPGPSGLETEFSGSEPDACLIAEQVVMLEPGDYSLSYSYRTSDIAAGTGIRWQVLDVKTNSVLTESADLGSNEQTWSGVGFRVPAGSGLVRVRLVYQRALGTPHIAGTLNILSTLIQPLKKL